jgi:Uma2 family endonuclease
MSTTIQATTAKELLRMPDDGFRYELVRGELRKMSPAGHRHGRIAGNITSSLGLHVVANKLGRVYVADTGFLISSDPDTVRAPDVAFVSQKRLDEVGDVEGYWPGAPDLVVEVISPGDTYTEVEEKVLEWLEAGALMVGCQSSKTRRNCLSLPYRYHSAYRRRHIGRWKCCARLDDGSGGHIRLADTTRMIAHLVVGQNSSFNRLS